MSFFDIPPEIRLEIYGYVANLNSAPFIDAHGLFLSCRQINDEMEHEGRKLLRSQYATTKRNLPTGGGILFDIPTTFHQLRHLRISLSTAVFTTYGPPIDPYILDQLQVILGLDLDSLTVTVHEEANAPWSDDNFEYIGRQILVRAMKGDSALKAQKLVVDLPQLTLWQAKSYIVSMADTTSHRVQWREADWVVRPGPRTILVLERIGSEKPVIRHCEGYVMKGLMSAQVEPSRFEIFAVKLMVGGLVLGCALDVVSHIVG
jgi:hypothetical protein